MEPALFWMLKDLGFGGLGFKGLRFRVWGLGLRVWGLGFMGLGLGVWGLRLRFRVQDLGV